MWISCATLFLLSAVREVGAFTKSDLTKHVDVLALDHSFNPVKAAYWTGYPHHRRTPFAVSPDQSSAYIAYLGSEETGVHIQALDPETFTAKGDAITISGAKEAGGLIAHNDGFALLTNEEMPSATANAPPGDTPVPVIYRYTDGQQTWKTWLGGPNVHADDGLSMSPDLNGDLVYSEEAGLYGAYFVVTDYSGPASGHFGDSIQYIAKDGTLETIADASSSWGCSHNTGIAFEAADAAPFASICAEDQGAIWLNTNNRGMSNTGVKISNENTTNGASGEPMGGMSGSYSALARFAQSTNYIFSWVSRGSVDISENAWMGNGYTNSQNRTNNRNVAIALFSDKYTKIGAQATSVVGSANGDSQVNWITSGNNDCSNTHAATFNANDAVVTWEEISDPVCDFIAMGCRGDFVGSFFQQVDVEGHKIGEPLKDSDVYVAGDIVSMNDGRICWPYVNMNWDLSHAVDDTSTSPTQKMSFACLNINDSGDSQASTTSTTVSIALNTATSLIGASTFTTQVRSSSTTEASSATTSAQLTSDITPSGSDTTSVLTSMDITTSTPSDSPLSIDQSSTVAVSVPSEGSQPTIPANPLCTASDTEVAPGSTKHEYPSSDHPASSTRLEFLRQLWRWLSSSRYIQRAGRLEGN